MKSPDQTNLDRIHYSETLLLYILFFDRKQQPKTNWIYVLKYSNIFQRKLFASNSAEWVRVQFIRHKLSLIFIDSSIPEMTSWRCCSSVDLICLSPSANWCQIQVQTLNMHCKGNHMNCTQGKWVFQQKMGVFLISANDRP